MEFLQVKLGFTTKLVVDRIWNNGDLCLFWMDTVDISLLSYSWFHIDTLVVSNKNKRWRLTGFYGQLDSSQRSHAWTLMSRLAGMSSLPWVLHV
jgi:hypothetical protein